MASTTGAAVRRPGSSRRFAWLAAFIVFLFCGYAFAWFYVAGMLRDRFVEFIDAANASGLEVECRNARAGGFPFRIGLFCDETRYADPGQFALSAEGVRSAAQVYNPFLVVAEVDGPAILDTTALALGASWDNLRASLRYSLEAPERISIEARDLATKMTPAGSGAVPLFSAKDAQAHARPNGDDLDVAASFEDLRIDPAVLAGGALPAFSGNGDVTIDDGMLRVNGGGDLLLGQAGTIRTLSLSTTDATLSLAGTFALDPQGLLDADLVVRANNPKAIAPIAAAAFPESAEAITASLSGLAALGENAELPLTIRKGEMTFGFLPLGKIGPLLVSR